jgi:hypothetical protein
MSGIKTNGPGHAQRLAYKRRIAGLMFVFFCVTAIILLSSTEASHFFPAKLVPAIPLMLLLLGLLAIKLSDWLAIQKFGAIEEKEQAVEAQERQAKLESLVASEGYKKRAYAKKLTACLMAVFIVIFFTLAWLAECFLHISGWITFNVALIAAVLLAYSISYKTTNQKFGGR